MIEQTLRRLQAAEQATGGNQRSFPDPLTALSAGELAILQPYLEARIRGDVRECEWSDDHHAIMRRYLRACAERGRAMEEAGIPAPPIASTILEHRALPSEVKLERLRQRFEALERRIQ